MNQLQQDINTTINKLIQQTEIDVQSSWYYVSGDINIDSNNFPLTILDKGEKAELNEKRYIVFGAGNQIIWLAQKIIIPTCLASYPLAGLSLRLALTWWAEEAQIFVDGNLLQEGDLFDSSCRLLLRESVQPPEELTVAIRLISPGHDIGALMNSKCIYEAPLGPSFVAQEMMILQKYWQKFEPEKITTLATELSQINWQAATNQSEFNQVLLKLRQNLIPLASDLKQRCIQMLTHAHLDLAWLWEVEETWQVAQRTFASVLQLQSDFPELTFCHTSPVLYEWLEHNRPQLFQKIQEAVKAGWWEVVGGMWVEPDVNLPSGESLIRQLLYGQKYIEEKFGNITKIAWLTDSFGFSWQLPQICQQCGIEYFVTQKLHWNDSNKFPHGLFWWESPDGTQLLTLISPPNVTGVMDNNPITQTNYALMWEEQTGIKNIFWLPGVGDHGGGPSRDMLEVQRCWQESPFFPQLKFTTASNYLNQVAKNPSLPVWKDELYLELHRGCYTTHGEQKYYNRRCEDLLYEAELWSSFATIVASCYYPQKELGIAWKQVLFNQFHDILPGTSITPVFNEANQKWQQVIETGTRIKNQALKKIASHISLPTPPKTDAQPLVIFNSLNWLRSEVVTVGVPEGNWSVYDLAGNEVPSQVSSEGELLFLAENIPGVGYRIFWLCQQDRKVEFTENEEFILENNYLKVIINPETGEIKQIYDKYHQQKILKGAGNQLQFFQDKGQYWDAWNIDPDYEKHLLAPAQLVSIEWQEKGEIKQSIRVVKKFDQSEFIQDYVLETNSPVLKIVTEVDWQESQVLVKAAFPLNLTSKTATYEIACGAIERPTQPKTEVEKAKWEVAGLRWADLTDKTQNYGISLLNDCKYGYDAKPNQIRLSLLRSPNWPDPQSDRGKHHFTYAIYPHKNSWQEANTVREGYHLNIPLQPLLLTTTGQTKATFLPSYHQFVNISGESLILIALKKAEGNTNNWIMRCYESQGKVNKFNLQSTFPITVTGSVDCLERPLKETNKEILPWQICSISLNHKLD